MTTSAILLQDRASAEDSTLSPPPSAVTPARFYRPDLDALRFLAFLAVFLHHTMNRNAHEASRLMVALADGLGFGLCLFFTLSAYLITKLLLIERAATGDIDLKRFYLRRALRIWPLYWLGLALGAIYAVHTGAFAQERVWFVGALFMCGNFLGYKGYLVSHLWSISVEEQFYVFSPSLMKKLGRYAPQLLAICLIILANIRLVHFGHKHSDTDLTVWMQSMVQFEMFAVGMLLAVYDKYRPKLSVFWSLALFAFALCVWVLAALKYGLKGHPAAALGPGTLCIGYALVALSCGMMLVAIAGIPRWPKFILYLGKISYGLYVFHAPIGLLLSQHLGSRLSRFEMATLIFVLTIAVAALSYRYFETPFLRMKRGLEIIKTRPV